MQLTEMARAPRTPWPETTRPEVEAVEPVEPVEPLLSAPVRERDGRREIARLRDEIERIVRSSRPDPRETLDNALESVTRMQVATANIDACGPPAAGFAGSALVALADLRLRGHADAIERGMTYTSDNQMQLLRGEH
jgi:hypothetical protein